MPKLLNPSNYFVLFVYDKIMSNFEKYLLSRCETKKFLTFIKEQENYSFIEVWPYTDAESLINIVEANQEFEFGAAFIVWSDTSKKIDKIFYLENLEDFVFDNTKCPYLAEIKNDHSEHKQIYITKNSKNEKSFFKRLFGITSE